MKTIIFLDFDGVLHPYFNDSKKDLFKYLSTFENTIRQLEEVQIVISSSWRLKHSFDQLKSLFSKDIQELIIGVTPEIKINFNESSDGLREKEILLFLENNHLTNNKWIAIDDDIYSFSNKENLYHCKDKFDENDSLNLINILNNNKTLKLKF